MSRILIYGDMHLTSKKVGYHIDYVTHSLGNLSYISKLTSERECTHLIGLGDLADGVFNLNYRLNVDSILKDIDNYTKSNHYTLKGNHDMSTTGMTEFDYYTKKGLIQHIDYLEVNGCNIYFADYGKLADVKIKDNGKKNILLSHDYLVFKDSTNVNTYYKPIYVEDYDNLQGMDLIICGHIHGKVRYTKDNVHIIYPGSSSMGAIDSELTCYFVQLDIDDNDYKISFIEYTKEKEKLFDLEKYNLDLEQKAITEGVKDNIAEVLNLDGLDSYNLDVTNFRIVINGLDLDDNVKSTAIDLLDEAGRQINRGNY